METKFFYKWIFALILFSSYTATAQTDSVGNEDDQTHFKIGVYYNSALNYYGRTDSLKSSGFFPMAELWFNKNFYVTAAPVFVNNAAVSFDYAGTVATAGFQFNENNKWFGNFYFVKPFYESSSQLVQSALKAQVAMSLSRMTQVINITVGGDIKLSDKIDLGITGGVDHIIRHQFADNSVLVIDPSAYVYAGTQQFTNTYYKKSNFLLFPGVEQSVSEEVKSFNILSYELSMPVIFAKGKFQLLFTPAYVIPQNLITVQGRPDLSERGKEMFYATVGAKLSL
jgi:hypothetical protein